MLRKSLYAGFVAIVTAALVAATGWAVGGMGTPARTSHDVPAVPEEPARVVLTADRPGESEFVCTNYCGYGHRYMSQTMLIVT